MVATDLFHRWLIYQAVNVTIPVPGEESHYGQPGCLFPFPLVPLSFSFLFLFLFASIYALVTREFAAASAFPARSIGTKYIKIFGGGNARK